MTTSRRVIFWAIAAIALYAGLKAELVGSTKRAPHFRLRAQIAERNAGWEYDRWFMPGPLGWSPAEGPEVQSQTADRRLESLMSKVRSRGSEEKEEGSRVSQAQVDVRKDDESAVDGTRSKTNRPSVTEKSFLTRALGGVDADWGEFNQLTPRLSFSHNLSRVVPRELFDEQPDLFPLIQGERWRPPPGLVNWNPDLGESATADHAALAAEAFFEENPDAHSFALGVNDGLRFGESPATLRWVEPVRWFRQRPDYSDLIFQFMNGVAERLETSWPDKHVGALAYYWTENTPSFPLHPNVLPFLTADRSQFYDRAFKREELALQKKWGASFEKADTLKSKKLTSDGEAEESNVKGLGGEALLASRRSEGLKVEGRGTGGQGGFNARAVGGTGQPSESRLSNVESPEAKNVGRKARPTFNPIDGPRLGIYDYIYGVGFLIPRIHTEYITEHIRHARAAGFTDYNAEMSPNWGLDGPQPWLVAQLLMDPKADVEALLDEYYARFFGAAARPMRRFFERCEEQWTKQTGPSYWLKHFKNDSQAQLFPREVGEELRVLLGEAGQRAGRAGDAVVIERIRFVSDAWGLTERYVAFCDIRNGLQKLLLLEQSKVEGLRGKKAREPIGKAGGRGQATPLQDALERYQEARAEFIRYAEWIQDESPLAFTRMLLDVFLRHDPGPTAEALLAAKSKVESRRSKVANEKNDPKGWEGNLLPGLEIAGLPFGLALPWGWQSTVEPWEGLVAELREAQFSESKVEGLSVTSHVKRDLTDGRGIAAEVNKAVGNHAEIGGKVLRLENHKLTSIIRGYHAPAVAEGHELGNWGIAVDVRGQLSESAFLCLTLRSYDQNMQPLGPATDTKFITGGYPRWAQLVQFPAIPEGTRFIGLTLWCAHQQPGDWLEIGEPYVVEAGDVRF